jgi:hypothetical protein
MIGTAASVPKYVGSPIAVVMPWAFEVAGNPVYVRPKPKFGTPFPSAEGMYPPACQVEIPEIVQPPPN